MGTFVAFNEVLGVGNVVAEDKTAVELVFYRERKQIIGRLSGVSVYNTAVQILVEGEGKCPAQFDVFQRISGGVQIENG